MLLALKEDNVSYSFYVIYSIWIVWLWIWNNMYTLGYIYICAIHKWHDYNSLSLHAIDYHWHVALLDVCLCLCAVHILHVHVGNISLLIYVCLYMEWLYHYMVSEVLYWQYCLHILAVLMTILPGFVILILYGLPLWQLSPWSVTRPCIQSLLFSLQTVTLDIWVYMYALIVSLFLNALFVFMFYLL